jgi:hypothetical protein
MFGRAHHDSAPRLAGQTGRFATTALRIKHRAARRPGSAALPRAVSKCALFAPRISTSETTRVPAKRLFGRCIRYFQTSLETNDGRNLGGRPAPAERHVYSREREGGPNAGL